MKTLPHCWRESVEVTPRRPSLALAAGRSPNALTSSTVTLLDGDGALNRAPEERQVTPTRCGRTPPRRRGHTATGGRRTRLARRCPRVQTGHVAARLSRVKDAS